nr:MULTISPECIES: iron chelate uptake ABC transporter family permease subunit [unclassified Corynebacterium]
MQAAAVRRNVSIVGTLLLLLLVCLAASLMVGERTYSLMEVLRVLAGEQVKSASYAVGELRLPRAILAVVGGSCFGIAGLTFQTLLRNQLASPDIVGISSGASAFGVVALVTFGAGQTATSLAALAGALITAAAIYLLAIRGTFSGTRLILIGIGISSMLMSVVTYVLSQAAAWDLAAASRWLTGSINGASWDRVLPLVATWAVGVPVLLLARRELAMLQLGQDLAAGLGVHTGRARVVLIAASVTLIAAATAACGPVSFVAFMSGPIAMRLGRRWPMLTAALVGALIMLLADFAGQHLLGTRYPVGVVTGMLGAPFLLYLLVRAQKGAA